MSPRFANVKAGEVGDVAGLFEERINGWIGSYPPEATSSALKDGVIIQGRPVDWAWAIPGTTEYFVVEFSDSHKQYVARMELPEFVTPAVRSSVKSAVTPAVTSATRCVIAPLAVVIRAARTEDPETSRHDAPPGNDETRELQPDLAYLADVARERVYAWIRSYPLSATSSALGDGSRVTGRPVGWAWAIPGTVEFLVVEFSDGHKEYLSPADLPVSARG
jgi:hypothetical protein